MDEGVMNGVLLSFHEFCVLILDRESVVGGGHASPHFVKLREVVRSFTTSIRVRMGSCALPISAFS